MGLANTASVVTDEHKSEWAVKDGGEDEDERCKKDDRCIGSKRYDPGGRQRKMKVVVQMYVW